MDLSNWLVDLKGLWPAPIVISDPAVGYGGGAAILFFHKSARDKEEKETNQELIFRLRNSNFFLGGRYQFLAADIDFDDFNDASDIEDISDDELNSSFI